MKKILLLVILTGIPLFIAVADELKETRLCSAIPRDSGGKIIRRADVIRAFKSYYPCPTGEKGKCTGWQIDHVIPLAVGGCDAVSNMQWLPNSLKSCKGTVCKDRWERKVYSHESR